MKKIVLTTVLILGIIPVCFADSLTGVVKDKLTGETLIGTVVQVKGEKHHATSTGLDGSFVLKDLPNQGTITLIASYIGYQSKEVQVDMSAGKSINLELEPELQELKEVVVKGFRTKDTDVSAYAMVKNSSQVLNVMSAQAIQVSFVE